MSQSIIVTTLYGKLPNNYIITYMSKDYSSISKQIINYIFHNGDWPLLTLEQQKVLSKGLPSILFELNRQKHLNRNNTIMDDKNNTYKINYNPRSKWVAYKNSQKGIRWWFENFNLIYDANTSPIANLRNLISKIGIEEFIKYSLYQISIDKEWILINKDITKILRVNYDILDFDLLKLETDILVSKSKSTWYVKWEKQNLIQIQQPASQDRPNSLIIRLNSELIENFITKVKTTNETWGISVEVAICNAFSILVPQEYDNRYDPFMVAEAQAILSQEESIKQLPKITECCATKRHGHIKSVVDFYASNKTISVKSNYNGGQKVCPPTFGQPGIKNGLEQYNQFFEIKVTLDDMKQGKWLLFKEQFQKNIKDIANRQLQLLLSEDYLIYMRKLKNGTITMDVYDKDVNDFKFEDYFSFTKTPNTWNESVTIKYKNNTIAEMQMHNARSPFKFRFNLIQVLKIINK